MGREYTGERGVRPDSLTFRTGVTSVVDAGSSGWRNFAEFKQQIIDTSQTRVLAMLNIVGHGMGGRNDVEQTTSDMDSERTAEVARQFKDIIVGVKTAHYAGKDWTAIDRTVAAGKLANIPVMIDFGTFHPERPFEEMVLKRLRPGDISTHSYYRLVPIFDDAGRVRPYLWEAKKRGIIFDVGHGGSAFSFKQAIPAVKQGFLPDSISSDLHVVSMNGGMKDMLNVMSKFLNMGMSLDEVIARSTWHPAREIRHEELGNLSPGAPADIAVLKLEKGGFGFLDAQGLRMRGTTRLATEVTIRNGKVVWDLNGITQPDWDSEQARAAAAR
jgi:dihydroorotase